MSSVTRTSSESGFTILEVLVAATLFLIGLSLMVSLLNTTLAKLGIDDLVAGRNIAESVLLTSLNNSDTTSLDSIVTYSGKKYQLKRTSRIDSSLIGWEITVSRYKQPKILVSLYGEKVLPAQ